MLARLGRKQYYLPAIAALLYALATARPSVPSPLPSDPLLLIERLVWLNNWQAAAAVIRQSRPIAADEATRLLHGAVLIRSDLEREPLDTAAGRIAELLAYPTASTDPRLRIHLLCVQGDLEFQRDLDAAEASWNEALEIANAIRAGDWESRALGELGTIAFLKGELRESLTLVGQAFLAAEASADVAAQIRYQTALGEGFAEFGRPNDAIRFFDKALDLARNTPGAYFPFTAHLGKAKLLALGGDDTEGRRLLEAALADAREQGLRIREARVLAVLGELAARRGDRMAATESYGAANEIVRKMGLRRLEASIGGRLAALLQEQGKLDAALQAARRSVQVAMRAGNSYHLPYLLAVEAEAAARAGRVSEATATYRRAEAMVEDLVAEIPEEGDRKILVSTMSPVFDGQFRLALRQTADPIKALRIIETAKTRALVPRAGRRSPAAATPELATLHVRLGHESNKARRADLLDRIWQTELRSYPIPDSPQHRRFASGLAPADVGQIQSALGDDEVLVEFVLGTPASAAIVITADRVCHYALADRAEIERAAEAYGLRVAANENAFGEARRLYELLLAPISEVQDHSRIIVVPDGRLNLLPFDGLIDEQGSFVLDRKVVSYAPSSTLLRVLVERGRDRRRATKLLAVGGANYRFDNDPGERSFRGRPLFDLVAPTLWSRLPQSAREVAAVGEIAGRNSVVLTGDDASEDRVMGLPLGSFGAIHFAVHAGVDPDFPARSALVLTPGARSRHDGLLQMREVAALELNASLVTLSACEAGWGRVEGIGGTNGLVQAFLLAGAATVVASVWPAEDTFTAALMRQFYRNLRAGHDKAAALTLAKRWMLRTYRDQAPASYWAGFRLVGDGRGRIWEVNDAW